jgi:hypothetical protein
MHYALEKVARIEKEIGSRKEKERSRKRKREGVRVGGRGGD